MHILGTMKLDYYCTVVVVIVTYYFSLPDRCIEFLVFILVWCSIQSSSYTSHCHQRIIPRIYYYRCYNHHRCRCHWSHPDWYSGLFFSVRFIASNFHNFPPGELRTCPWFGFKLVPSTVVIISLKRDRKRGEGDMCPLKFPNKHFP